MNEFPSLIRPRLHEQIKPPVIAQILDPYELTPDEFAQINVVLFAQILDPYEVTPDAFAQIKYVLFASVNEALGSVYMS